MHLRRPIILLYILLSCVFAAAQDTPKAAPSPPATPEQKASAPAGREPIIIIPGLTGSQLVNKNTGEVVWFKTSRSKDDDLRLPISPTLSRNTDSLIAGDVIRE